MAYGTTAPVTLAKPASSTRRIAAAGVAVLLVGACVTALVSQHAGLELTSHVQQGNLSAAQTDLVWEDRVKLFREFKLAVASSENLTSDVAIIDTGKTSQSLCLNKKLADLTTSHEDQQTRNEGVIGDGPWTSKGTVYDDYSNSRNKVALKDSSYEEVATAKARVNLVSGFLKALEVEESAKMYETEMEAPGFNDTNKPLLAPTIRMVQDAREYVEMVKERFPDLVMECFVLDCKPGLGFYVTGGGNKCKPCEVGKTFNDQTDTEECAKNVDECGPGAKLVVSTAATVDSACGGCESGTFNAHTDGSTTCELYSVTSCAAGKELGTGSPDMDAECTACGTGKFQSENNAGAHHKCTPHSDLECPLGQEEQDGTAEKDVACVTCPAGKTTYVTGEECRLPKAPITCAAGHEISGGKCRACLPLTFKDHHGSGKCVPHNIRSCTCEGQVLPEGGRMWCTSELQQGNTVSDGFCVEMYGTRNYCTGDYKTGEEYKCTYGSQTHKPTNIAAKEKCFPASATVQTPEGQVRMDQLQVGDAVLDGDGLFSPIFMFGHKDPGADSPFVELRTATNHTIQMSATHYLEADGVMMNAGDVRPGMTVIGGGEQSAVTSTKMIAAKGLYNPITLSGTIVVNGVAASAHSEWFLDGLLPTRWLPTVYQAFLAPARAIYWMNPAWAKRIDVALNKELPGGSNTLEQGTL